MALVVEDGTGKSDANSFVTDAEFVSWAKARGRYDTLPSSIDSGGARAPYLVLAADYLANEKRFRWRGIRKTAAQALPWPRVGVADRDGLVWPDGTVPWRVKQGQCEAAYLSMTGSELQPSLDRGGRVVSESVGPISTTYAPDAPTETEIPSVVGILEPLLYTSTQSRLRAQPYITDEVIVPGYDGSYLPEDVSS